MLVGYFFTFLSVLAGAVVAPALLLYSVQRRAIYLRDSPVGSRTFVWKPPMFGMDEYKEIKIRTRDGVDIYAYLIPCRTKGIVLSSTTNISTVTLIYCHANSGNMVRVGVDSVAIRQLTFLFGFPNQGHRLSLVKRFLEDLKVNVLIFSYRGYGKSESEPSEEGLKLDVEAVIKYAKDSPEYGSTKIVMYGQSLGGAVAIYAAAKFSEKIDALIVENTFFGLDRVCVDTVPLLGSFMKILIKDKWRSFSDIAKVSERIPMLIIYGNGDELINPSHSKDLCRIAVRQRAKILGKYCGDDPIAESSKFKVRIVGLDGDHNQTCVGPDYIRTVRRFLVNYFPELKSV